MTDRYEIGFSDNPVFETVTGLTNTSFDSDNVVENRMATEGQLLQVHNRYNEVAEKADYCCRDIVTWKSYVRVVTESTGYIISPWVENVNVGTARRGKFFTVEFPIPFAGGKYFQNSSYFSNSNYDSSYRLLIRASIPGYGEVVDAGLLSTTAVGGRDYFSSSYPGSTSNTITDTLTRADPLWSLEDRDVALNQNTFPRWSTDPVADQYYIYKEGDTLKIDVKKTDLYPEGKNLAVFMVQYVISREYM